MNTGTETVNEYNILKMNIPNIFVHYCGLLLLNLASS